MSGNTRDLLSPVVGIVIPAGQALVSGFICGILGGSLAELAGAENPLPWAALTFGAVSLAAWLAGVNWWRSAISPHIQPAEPVKIYSAETRLKLSIDWDQGRAGLFDEIGVSDEMFIAWAAGVGSGVSLGENHWTGAANPFSKGQYHRMLDRLNFHGMIKQVGKARTSGFTLTRKGEAVCNAILDRYGPALSSPASVRYLPN